MAIRFLRRHTKKVFLAILLLIIPAFCFWGVATTARMKGKKTVVALVEGRKITESTFYELTRYAKRQYLFDLISRLAIKNHQDFQQRKNSLLFYLRLFDMGSKDAAWERLLLLKEATALGLRIPENVLRDWILAFPLFFTNDNEFSVDLYNSVVKQMFSETLVSFERQLIDDLKVNQMRELLSASALVSPLEIQQHVAMTLERLAVAYIRVNHQDYLHSATKDPVAAPSAEEITAYYDKNKRSFMLPAAIKCGYVMFSETQFESDVTIADEEIKAYYDSHQAEFTSPDSKKPQPLESVKIGIEEKLRKQRINQLVREKADDFSILLIRDASLEEAASKRNAHYQVTDFFSEDSALPHPLNQPGTKEVLLRLEEEHVSEAIALEGGVLIAQCLERKEPRVPLQEEIKPQLHAAASKKKAQDKAYERALHFQKEVERLIQEERIEFAEACSSLNLKPQYPEPFTRSGKIAHIQNAGTFIRKAFLVPIEHVGDPVGVDDDYFLIYPLDAIPAAQDKDTAEEAKNGQLLLSQKQRRIEQQAMARLVQSYSLKSRLEQVTKPEIDSTI